MGVLYKIIIELFDTEGEGIRVQNTKVLIQPRITVGFTNWPWTSFPPHNSSNYPTCVHTCTHQLVTDASPFVQQMWRVKAKPKLHSVSPITKMSPKAQLSTLERRWMDE